MVATQVALATFSAALHIALRGRTRHVGLTGENTEGVMQPRKPKKGFSSDEAIMDRDVVLLNALICCLVQNTPLLKGTAMGETVLRRS